MTTQQFASTNPKNNYTMDQIEILPVSLLDENRQIVNELRQTAQAFGLEFGWHYLLDLTWMLRQLGPLDGKQIMDAGAGTGVIQWYLAQQGAEVISVDRNSRAGLPVRFRSLIRVEGLRPEDLQAPQSSIHPSPDGNSQPFSLRRILSRLKNSIRNQLDLRRHPASSGKVRIYNQDLSDLADIPDNSLDAVVAVSALEHNTPEGLSEVVKELQRVLKPGGILLATLGAAKEDDWFHQASHGWCYTDTSLRKLLDLPASTPSNYVTYDQIMTDLKNCSELRDNLASFYYKSGDNGMPWGVWDPQYPPVGVRKVKPSNKSQEV
ncbi:MAG TPA: class I SAM-dependent methyltransferase [Anaerolineales bacterium]|nr:class I SAM-dependent methyltransferase [Anaerolineales bacterium]